MTTPPPGGKHHVCRAFKDAGERLWLSDITADDVERRSEFCLRTHRVPGEDTDWYTLTLKGERSEKARPSSTADY